MTRMIAVAALVALMAVCVSTALAQDIKPPRILFLSKSEGFEHSPVAVKDGKPSLAETVLEQLAKDNGSPFTSTKDASLINADNLKNYDMVIFYTQGDLTKPSKDGGAPMGEKGQADLVEWVKNGGRFMGFHSASDTFHTPANGEVTPYLNMLGAEFTSHGGQFKGKLNIVDPFHPAMKSVPKDWSFEEEWYLFNHFNKASMHVLALLDPSEGGVKQDKYRIPPYPVIWCSAFGKGKVYFSALGHREDVWESPVFKSSILDAGMWLMAPGTEGTEPN
ncbi:MAG: ThuA domain-containing protein, partial [Candidatus Hydrogenedentes bacterium]|nr:ThuA domain-containing protein [Candidatus Hydrogenedentota bacterium]